VGKSNRLVLYLCAKLVAQASGLHMGGILQAGRLRYLLKRTHHSTAFAH
jgi:hypothetical protein